MSLLFKTLQIDTQMKVHKINVNTIRKSKKKTSLYFCIFKSVSTRFYASNIRVFTLNLYRSSRHLLSLRK